MIKCTGICATCGRCKDSAMMSGANERKTKMLSYPEGFSADTGGNGLGVAFDIGTTTVVGMLWDLEKGEQIATAAKTNPQNQFGMDVISRITYSGRKGENLEVLREKIVTCLNEITKELCEKAGEYKTADVVKAAICGNTTMSHLVAGYSPISLAIAPFAPAYTGMLSMTAAEAGLKIGGTDEAGVIVIPNIAGHVGGDITAGIIASEVLSMDGLTIFIDIGTNGEIVLTDGEHNLACSTAAGPAFEGAAIRCGMRAATGAIEKVKITNGDVLFRTIGEAKPQGICGSGLIDVIAQMLDAGLIDRNGRLAAAEEVEKKGIDKRLEEQLLEVDGERRFVLVPGGDTDISGETSEIVITQNDIREVQLAKGAISAGIQLMLGSMDKSADDIDHVVIAGAFGNYIDKESAVRIGVLPNIPLDKIISAGNTAGAGISMVLVSRESEDFARRIPDIVEHVELAEDPNFQMVYMKAMGFDK
ncbi:MAG: ASKHA domain-containing protein [Lentihominibacter sp.]|jgi:uncharacterized 2Fe-2S/4Fe-4S cluster protein (DUF4445 family)